MDKRKCAICYEKREPPNFNPPLNKEEYKEYAGGLFALWDKNPRAAVVIWVCGGCRPGRVAQGIVPFNWWYWWYFRKRRNKYKRAVNMLEHGD